MIDFEIPEETEFTLVAPVRVGQDETDFDDALFASLVEIALTGSRAPSDTPLASDLPGPGGVEIGIDGGAFTSQAADATFETEIRIKDKGSCSCTENCDRIHTSVQNRVGHCEAEPVFLGTF